MDTLFFIAARLSGALIRAETWIVLALGMAILAILRRRRRQSILWSAMALVALVLLAVMPLGDLLLRPIEGRYPPDPGLSRVDGIIVLGGGEDVPASAYWGQVQLNEAGERLTAALALARRFPQARILFTGGSGALVGLVRERPSEAGLAGRLFREHGIADARLLREDRSRNTAENARLGRALAVPRQGEVWVLVTSAAHMPRAMRSFEAAGWRGLVPYPVDFRTASVADGLGWDLARNLRMLNFAVRERVGQLVYRLAGNA